MSDGNMQPGQRLRALAAESLAGYKGGTVSLRQLVDNLDVVWNGLERSGWSDEFREHWWTLEQVYSVALDRGELHPLPAEYLTAISEAVAGLETVLDSWPENVTRS